MNSRELFDRLIRAEHEDEVDQILSLAGYGLDNEAVWKPLGDIENNFSTVANQQAEATGALVEKVINGIDSLLMAECFRRRINPEGFEAPRTMGDAVGQFFNVKDGRLENLDSKEQTGLAQNLQVVAGGEKSLTCYLISDTGEGQPQHHFPTLSSPSNARTRCGYPSFRASTILGAPVCCSSAARRTCNCSSRSAILWP